MNSLIPSFQTILIGGGVVMLLGLFVASIRGWLTWKEAIFGTLVIAAATIAAIWPDATTQIARRLGLDRGKDLILYCTTLAMMIGFVMVYVRLRRLRANVTTLVRELAIMQAREPDSRHER